MNPGKKQLDNTPNVGRRDFLKGLATLPVFGVFFTSYLAKRSHDRSHKKNIYADLDLDLEEFENSKLFTSKKPEDLIRLGIIGIGSRGEDILASLGFSERDAKDGSDSYADLNITLAGVCDVYDVAAEKGIAMSQFNLFSRQKSSTTRAKRYRHYQEMLESKDIDAVIIATPDHWHEQMVIHAARSGKHIYCEKCLTRTIEEALQVRDEIKASKVAFQYGHQNRQQNAYHVARKIIEKNILGKITLIKTHTNRNTPEGAWLRHLNRNIDPNAVDWQQWLGNTPQQPFSPSRYFGWQKFFEYSGGLPAHMFSHEYDAINQIFNLGIPKSVVASGGTYYWKDDRNTPDVFQAIFEYPDRELLLTYDATLASSSTGEYQTGAKTKEIYGSDAWMKLSMDINVMADRHSRRFKQKIDDGMIQPSLPFLSYRPGLKPGSLDVVTSASERYYASQGLVYTYQGGKKIDVTYLHVKDWLDCIRNGGTPSCTIDHAFEDAITCLMATKSYQEGRKVEWDKVNEKVI